MENLKLIKNYKFQIKNYTRFGQSLFEVVLALAVVSLVVVGLVILSTNSIRNATFSKNKNLASRYAQEATEWLRSERNKDPSNFRSRVLTPVYCLNSLSWGNLGTCLSGEVIGSSHLRREVNFSNSTTTNNRGETVIIINASIKVYWQDAQGLHEVKSVTDFTDLRQL